MKTILTTALLLSAGTALSQATTLLTDTTAYFATMVFSFGNQSSGTQKMTGATVSTGDDFVSAKFSYASTDTRNYYSFQTASTQTWAPNVNVGTSGNPWKVCLTITNSSSSDYTFSALQLGMSGLTSTGAAQNSSGGISSYTGTIISNGSTYKPIDMTISYYTGVYSEPANTTELVASIAYDMANTSSSPSTGTFSFDTITIAADSSLTLVFTASNDSQYTSGTYAGITTLS